MFFFFQAEDGIRDVAVTGVQTCALPIFYAGTKGDAVYKSYDGGQRWVSQRTGLDDVTVTSVVNQIVFDPRDIDTRPPQARQDAPLPVDTRPPQASSHPPPPGTVSPPPPQPAQTGALPPGRA